MTSTYGLSVQTFPVPPAGFDLEKASDTERAKYGIPRLHRLPALERRWVEATRGTRFITPKLTRGESVLPQRGAGDVELDDVLYDSQFVGCTVMAPGYEDGVASAHPFAAVYGWFNVPEVWPGASAQVGVQQSLSPWVGMGFWLGGSILQAGCACIVTPADTPLGESQYLYAPWFEWWPNHATYLTSEDVQHPDPLAAPGDQFVCSLLYCPWIIPELSDGGIDALGLLSNRTQGWSCLIFASAPDDHLFYGYDADDHRGASDRISANERRSIHQLPNVDEKRHFAHLRRRRHHRSGRWQQQRPGDGNPKPPRQGLHNRHLIGDQLTRRLMRSPANARISQAVCGNLTVVGHRDRPKDPFSTNPDVSWSWRGGLIGSDCGFRS